MVAFQFCIFFNRSLIVQGKLVLHNMEDKKCCFYLRSDFDRSMSCEKLFYSANWAERKKVYWTSCFKFIKLLQPVWTLLNILRLQLTIKRRVETFLQSNPKFVTNSFYIDIFSLLTHIIFFKWKASITIQSLHWHKFFNLLYTFRKYLGFKSVFFCQKIVICQ